MLEAAIFEAAAETDKAVMIGDTTFDIEMGRAANVASIGVAWGYHPPEELVNAGAAAIAQDVTQLSQILKEWT